MSGGNSLPMLAEGMIGQLRDWMFFIGGDELREHPDRVPSDIQLIYMSLEHTTKVITLDHILKSDCSEYIRGLSSLVASGALDKKFVGYGDADFKYMPHDLRDNPREFYKKNLDYISSFLLYDKSKFINV